MTPHSASQGNFSSIQCLRGIAALLVVVFHAHGAVFLKFSTAPSLLNAHEGLRTFGVVGVDIFFVVSGFIMFYVYSKDFGTPKASLNFFARRLIRIVPLYWIFTGLMAFLLLVVPGAFATLKFDATHILESFLFLPTTNSAGEYFPVLNVGWTLTYEMYFYALFGLALCSNARVALGLIGAWFVVSAVAGHWLPRDSAELYMLLNDILVEFVLGGAIGLAALKGYRLPLGAAHLVLLGGLTAFAAQIVLGDPGWGRLPVRGLPAACVVAALVSMEMHGTFRPPAWLARAGDQSYSLYLCHSLAQTAFFKTVVLLGAQTWMAADLLIAMAVFVSMLAGHFVYITLERPVTRALNRRWTSTWRAISARSSRLAV